jgi:choline monooxygenase
VERTLPWSWYTEPDVLRREHERIFRSAWQYVGHVGDLPTTRSYTAARAADVPVLLVRDGDDVRAFLNVCRHRGTQLVDGPAGRETIQCPYHAWTYGLDGALQCAPRSDREPAFEPDGLGLLPLAIERWGPFVFVNPDRNPPPLVDALGPVPGLVRDAGVDVDALVFHHRSQSSYQANWKICCENYLECYHCAVAHPGFSAVMDVRPDAYRLEQTTALVSTQLAPVRANGGSGPSTDGEVTRGQFHFVWPNLTVNIAPGRPNISLGPVLPEGPERTSRSLDFFFAADADPAWIGELLAWDDQVGAEDLALVERVQSGVRAGMLDAGVLLAESEQLVAGFDARIRAALM